MLVQQWLRRRLLGLREQKTAALLTPHPAEPTADQRQRQPITGGMPVGGEGALRRHQRLGSEVVGLLQGCGQVSVEAPLAFRREFLPGRNGRLPGRQPQASQRLRRWQQLSPDGVGEHQADQPQRPPLSAPAADLPEAPAPAELKYGQATAAQPTRQPRQGTIQRQNAAAQTDPEQWGPLEQQLRSSPQQCEQDQADQR